MRVLVRAMLLLAAASLATGCGATGISESDEVSRGKTLFQENCQQCHALRDAGSTAVTGPDLDAAFRRSRKDGIPQSTIEQVVRGQIAYPAPPMPANLVEGEEAAAVAAYVAEVAATKRRVTAAPATPQDQGGGEETTAGGTGTGGGTETGGGEEERRTPRKRLGEVHPEEDRRCSGADCEECRERHEHALGNVTEDDRGERDRHDREADHERDLRRARRDEGTHVEQGRPQRTEQDRLQAVEARAGAAAAKKGDQSGQRRKRVSKRGHRVSLRAFR